MITSDEIVKVRSWFTGRLPKEWQPVEVTVDREEIVVRLTIADVESSDGLDPAEARAGRTKAFREDTRSQRMTIAREAQSRFDRTVSWAVTIGDRTELFTHVSAPVMTRLRQPQRQVLDTLVAGGVARSRAEALGWCVRLVGQHEADWLKELQDSLTAVATARANGPVA